MHAKPFTYRLTQLRQSIQSIGRFSGWPIHGSISLLTGFLTGRSIDSFAAWFISLFTDGPLGCLMGALLSLLCSCSHSDIGEACPKLVVNTATLQAGIDPTIISSENVVATGPDFEQCSALTCVATQGQQGYCTAACLDDSSCPNGFSCTVVQKIGAFAGQKFCTWKICQSRGDCGPNKNFCCTQVAGFPALPQFKQCAFSTDGKCP